MKKTVSLLALSLLPFLAIAAPGHSGHGMSAHDMTGMPHADSAVGQPGDPASVSRTIEIVMDDNMRFTPGDIQVEAGETVRFLISNVGQLPHEMVIGSMAELKAHAAEMLAAPGMEHEEPNMITLQPGEEGDLVWQFDQPGMVDFACLIPGHTEAGMVGKVEVI